MADVENNEDLDPLVGMDPRKVLARVLNTASVDIDGKEWSPLDPKEVDALLSGYEVKSLIGRGGMGAVYQVYHEELHRVCALKLLPLSVSQRPDFEERFLREARAMANLHHPHIVHIYDFGRSSMGHLYYVMEYVEGADLACLIKDGGVSYREALNIVSQVCEALDYAHEKGYVHRDIKPSNVLMNAEGQVKVVDFGVAKIMHDQGVDPTMTVQGELMGTPGYMSPEQTVGGEIDHRSDIYALGVMLYEMLTGSLPQGNFELPSKKSGVDESLDDVVMQALHQEPERRYQSAGDVKVAITNCGEKDGATGASLKEKRPPQWWLAMLSIVLFVLSGMIYFKAIRDLESSIRARPTAASVHENSLGMRLVPVRGTKVLFSQTEVSWRDWDTFLAETDYSWESPTFNHPSNHAALNISWEDTQAFCAWLTEKERGEGLIGKELHYRLPTDREWSAAVGLIGEGGETPELRSDSNKGGYGWGESWPVPAEVAAEIDYVDSDAFGLVKAIRDTHRLLAAPMDPKRVKEFKGQTYWMNSQPWRGKVNAMASDLIYIPEHTGRLMHAATDKVQFRHWNGKTVVLMGRWMAKHAEVALPLVGWQVADWTDPEFREFFRQESWGFESGLSLFTPARWDGVKGHWLHEEKPIPLELFASPEDRLRKHHLRVELLNGELSFHHDNRSKVCYPVVVFDGLLDEAGLRDQVSQAYDKLRVRWYSQAARVCADLLPTYEKEWVTRSQAVDSLRENEFDLYGTIGGAKEWVQDEYNENALKTLRGGAMRLRGRGPVYRENTHSDREFVDSVIIYGISAKEELRISYREGEKATVRRPWYGFRVVLELK